MIRPYFFWVKYVPLRSNANYLFYAEEICYAPLASYMVALKRSSADETHILANFSWFCSKWLVTQESHRMVYWMSVSDPIELTDHDKVFCSFSVISRSFHSFLVESAVAALFLQSDYVLPHLCHALFFSCFYFLVSSICPIEPFKLPSNYKLLLVCPRIFFRFIPSLRLSSSPFLCLLVLCTHHPTLQLETLCSDRRHHELVIQTHWSLLLFLLLPFYRCFPCQLFVFSKVLPHWDLVLSRRVRR